jgi:hypothetical protein
VAFPTTKFIFNSNRSSLLGEEEKKSFSRLTEGWEVKLMFALSINDGRILLNGDEMCRPVVNDMK